MAPTAVRRGEGKANDGLAFALLLLAGGLKASGWVCCGRVERLNARGDESNRFLSGLVVPLVSWQLLGAVSDNAARNEAGLHTDDWGSAERERRHF